MAQETSGYGYRGKLPSAFTAARTRHENECRVRCGRWELSLYRFGPSKHRRGTRNGVPSARISVKWEAHHMYECGQGAGTDRHRGNRRLLMNMSSSSKAKAKEEEQVKHEQGRIQVPPQVVVPLTWLPLPRPHPLPTSLFSNSYRYHVLKDKSWIPLCNSLEGLGADEMDPNWRVLLNPTWETGLRPART